MLEAVQIYAGGESDMNNYVDIFEQSYKRAIGDDSYNPDFIERFYDIFLARSERISAMFEDTDTSAQKTMLHDSLLYMVDFFTSRRTIEHMDKIAAVHGVEGHEIPEDLYDLWMESLVEAVKEFDADFDTEIELAWRLVLSPGITFMKFMRDRAT